MTYEKGKEERAMGRIRFLAGLIALQILLLVQIGAAEEEAKKIGEIQVVAPREDTGVVLAPEETVIDVDTYETPGIPQNITDILKDRAIVDFRGESSLVPDDDTIYLKGFDASRFTTAIDTLTVMKTGGRKSSHIVDYALLPTFLIDKIEILPGPHSALYPGKSIGGVLNLITKRPERYPSLKPEAHLSTSYASYETQHHNMTVRGGVDSLIYDLAYDKYHTDGYLRNNEADIDTWYGRLGCLLPSDGFLTFSGSYSDADRQIPVDNLPGTPGYDSDYPKADTSLNYEIPSTWDKEAYSYRFNLEQQTPFGLWTAGAYDGKENRKRNYTASGVYSEGETIWWQRGGRIQDEIRFSENHTTTLGYERHMLWDNGPGEKADRVRSQGGYAQHEWTMIPRLSLTAGLRYEDIRIWVQNFSGSDGDKYNTAYDYWVERHFDDLMPKSFLTYELDDLAEGLRDTSLSLGVSKIWHAPDYHGIYNGQGRPSGIFLEPEHGMGYDFILNRRLWSDVQLKVDYSFYEIKDYMAQNSQFAQYSGGGAGDLRYSDYKINLEKVDRHGIEVELGGHLLDSLSFYLTYSWQDFVNKGDEPAGETELDQRAKNRVTTGLRYNLFENTVLMADFRYQSKEVSEIIDAATEEVVGTTQIDPYEVVDLGVQQTLFKEWGPLRETRLKFYVTNVFNERYEDQDGLPATDQVYGAALDCGF
jgi:outer membrane receptor protein involved in Fe transport